MAQRKSAEERKRKLKERTRQSAEDSDTKIGSASVLDLSIINRKIERFTPKSGREKNLIDILPFIITQEWYSKLKSFSGRPTGLEPGDEDYKLEVPVHYGIGPDKLTFICLREAFGQSCKPCQDRFEEMDKEDADEKIVDDLKARWRNFYCVYDYDDGDKGIQLWEHSYHLFEKFLAEEVLLDNDGIIVFSDLADGRSIEFKGQEKKLGRNAYIEAQAIEFLVRDPYTEDILDQTLPLDKMLIIPTPEEVTAAYLGQGSEEQPNRRTVPPADTGRTKPTREQPRRRTRADIDQKVTETRPPEERGDHDVPSNAGNPCPAGGKFGTDCNELPECKDCLQEKFESCIDEQDRLAKGTTEPPPQDPQPPRERRTGRTPERRSRRTI